MDEANQNDISIGLPLPTEGEGKPFEFPNIADKLHLTRKSHSQGSIEGKDYSVLAKKIDVSIFEPPTKPRKKKTAAAKEVTAKPEAGENTEAREDEAAAAAAAAALPPVAPKKKVVKKKVAKSLRNLSLRRDPSKDDELSNLATKMKHSTPLNPENAVKVLTEHSEALKLVTPENIGRFRAIAKAAGKEIKKENNNSSSSASTNPVGAAGGVSSANLSRKKSSVGATIVKDCHLSNVLRSIQRSLENLRDVRESLSNVVAEDDTLSKGFKITELSPEMARVARVAEEITALTREAFIPAHRLNQTAIALHNAEDFLRYPSDTRAFDVASAGRIKLPEPGFNTVTLEKMRAVVDRATAFYNKFDIKGVSTDVQDILFLAMRAMQDLYACTLGCQEIFKILMYNTAKEKHHLQQFLLSLPSMERSEMLQEVQELRRLVDEVVIVLEKLSWGAFVVYRLATGKNSVPNSTDTQGGPFAKMDPTSLTMYPGYPTYVKGTGTAAAASAARVARNRAPTAAKVKAKPSANVLKPKKSELVKVASVKKVNSNSGEAKAAGGATAGAAGGATKKKVVKNKMKTKTTQSSLVSLTKTDSDHKKKPPVRAKAKAKPKAKAKTAGTETGSGTADTTATTDATDTTDKTASAPTTTETATGTATDDNADPASVWMQLAEKFAKSAT